MAISHVGAFPFNWFSSLTPVFDVATPLGLGRSTPKVTAAVAQDNYTVRVTFSEEMLHVNPANTNDSLNPANYIFTTVGGAPVSASSVSLHQANPTVVDITLASEMTNAATYNVEVQRVENLSGQVVDPAEDNKDFTGIGVAPRVASASAYDAATVRMVFDEAMLNTAQLRTPALYAFTGPTVLVPDSVSVVNPTTVAVGIIGEMRTGGSYGISVGPPYSGIEDVAWNLLDGAHHTASFTGLGVAPQVTGATAVDGFTVDIDFSENVQEIPAETPGNYAITVVGGSGTLSVSTATKITDTRVRLVTAEQHTGTHYRVTVTSVPDLAGNDIDPAHNTADFYGVGSSPPTVEMSPPHETKDMPVRNFISVNMRDTSEEFTGIDQSKCWIKVQYYLPSGVLVDTYAVKDGVIMDGFSGRTSGDPLSAEGITFDFRPRGNWPEETDIRVWAYAEDLEGTGATLLPSPTVVTTGETVCFEDIEQDPLPIETTIMSRMGAPNIDRLRRLMLEACSTSTNQRARARTLMFLASMTELKSMLSVGDFNFEWANVKLCDRVPVLDIHMMLRKYPRVFSNAILELPGLTTEARELLRRYQNSSSSVYVVNTAAVIVVLAALLGV